MLTNNDINAIVKALQPFFRNIDKRFIAIDKRFAVMDNRFENVEKEIKQLREETAVFIGSIVEKVATQDQISELRGQIAELGYLKHTAHIASKS